jgi:hypothetical protein
MKSEFKFDALIHLSLFVFFFLIHFPAQAEVSSACRSDLLRVAVWPFRPTCTQLSELSRFEVKSECQLYRFSDLDESTRQSLQQALKKHAFLPDDRDRLSAIMGRFRSLAGKKLVACGEGDSLQKLKVDTRQELLIEAIQKGNLEKVKDLIAKKASANVPFKKKNLELWPLMEAARSGRYEILRYLRDQGNAKPFKKIAGSETIIDRMNNEIAMCEQSVSKCSAHRKEYLQKSVRILVHYE